MYVRLIVAVSFLLVLGNSTADELAIPLEVEAQYLDLAGLPLEEIDRDAGFQISLTYRRADGQSVPDALAPRGWLRPHDVSNGTCEAAAQQFSLSEHVLPRGVIDLSRTLIGVSTEKGAFSIVDPQINLASANMIAATTFDQAPDWLESDSMGNRFLAVFRDSGSVLAIDAYTGEVTKVANELHQPSAAFAGPKTNIWVYESGTRRLLRVGPNGTQVVQENLTALPQADGARKKIASITSENVTVHNIAMDMQSTIFDLDNAQTAVPLGHHSHYLAAVLAGGTLHLLGPEQKQLRLPHSANKLISDMHGRWLAAFSQNQAAPISLIDIHTGLLRQVVPISTPVTELAFGHNMLFVMTADQAMIRAVDFSNTKSDQYPVRRLGFGQPSDVTVGTGLIAPLGAGHGVIAVHRDSYTGFLIHPVAAKTDMPPMHPVPLRGGVPQRISTISKHFMANGNEQYINVAKLGDAPAYELVTISGVNSHAACFVLPLPESERVNSVTWYLQKVPSGLVLLNEDSVPVSNKNLNILLTGLRTPDRQFFRLRTDENGVLPLKDVSDFISPYAISASLSDGPSIRTLVIE